MARFHRCQEKHEMKFVTKRSSVDLAWGGGARAGGSSLHEEMNAGRLRASEQKENEDACIGEGAAATQRMWSAKAPLPVEEELIGSEDDAVEERSLRRSPSLEIENMRTKTKPREQRQ